MEQIDLSGFQMCHLDDDQHSVLREKRVVLGMTQQQVADKAGIILQQYQKFESGERDIMTSSFKQPVRWSRRWEWISRIFTTGNIQSGKKCIHQRKGCGTRKQAD